MSGDPDDNCVESSPFGDNVLLNGWMFCAAHSREYCHRCTCDHRSCNNIQLEDMLTEDDCEALTDYGLQSLDDRQPLQVTGLWKKVRGSRTACTAHSTIGCRRCFDFKKMLLPKAATPPAAGTATAAPAAAAAAAAPAGVAVEEEDTSRKCWSCGVRKGEGVALKKCSACARAKYCSKQCQVSHYPQHKTQCKEWRQQRAAAE